MRVRTHGDKRLFQFVGVVTALIIGVGSGVGSMSGVVPAEVAAATPPITEDNPPVTDERISDQVENEFLVDPAIPLNKIDVETEDGIVTLKGAVNSVLIKERAEQIAGTVRGVRVVVNEIGVEPLGDQTDEEIRADIESALGTHPVAEAFEVDVEVDDGVAELSGSVDSWAEQQIALDLAKNVHGVRAVHNALTIEPEVPRTDAEIKSKVMQALRWDKLLDHELIDVDVESGVVDLDGTVGSAAEKTRAIADAWALGGTEVDAEDLEVRFGARDESMGAATDVDRADEEIRQAIADAFLMNPRVKSFEIEPEVSDGVVTLRGKVDNLDAKRSAGRIAEETVGVERVKNRLKVRPTGELEDVTIETRIRQALDRNPIVEPFEITVTVIDGVAHLYGTVDSVYEKAKADDIVAKVKGVEEVENNLERQRDEVTLFDPYVDEWYAQEYDWFQPQPGVTLESDWEIKEAINEELWWSPFVDADDVSVTVDDGVATLDGTVETRRERQAAMDNAFEAGAIWVDNDLEVSSEDGDAWFF